VAVSPSFFRATVTPLGVAMLAVFAASPLLHGRPTAGLRRELTLRAAVALAVVAVALLLDGPAHPGVALVLALAALAQLTIVQRARARLVVAPSETSGDSATARPAGRLNTIRRLGPYVAHSGLVLLLAAVTINVAYQAQSTVTLRVGEQTASAVGQIGLTDLHVEPQGTRATFVATVDITAPAGGGRTSVDTRQVVFANREQPNAEVGIDGGIAKDLYVVLESADIDRGEARVTVFVNPAVAWIWIGGLLLVIGGVVSAIPARPAPRAGRQAASAGEVERGAVR
jgi:cytochrome c-type biogenesis protein CcmF